MLTDEVRRVPVVQMGNNVVFLAELHVFHDFSAQLKHGLQSANRDI